MKMLSSSRPPSARRPRPAAARSAWCGSRCSVSPASRSFRIRATSCTALRRRRRAGTSTKIVRTTPLRRLNTSSRRSDAHRHQLEPLEHHLVQRRRHRHAQLLGQDAEHLGRAPQDLLDRASREPSSSGLQRVPRLRARRRQAHDLVHVHPVRPIGRDPAGRGVRMEEVALVLQLAHRVADRGRATRPARTGGQWSGFPPARRSRCRSGRPPRGPGAPVRSTARAWAWSRNLFGLTARSAPALGCEVGRAYRPPRSP